MNEKYTIPVAIVIAGLLIAGAVMYGGDSRNQANESDKPEDTSANIDAYSPVTEDDHILGSPDAPITIIEYSDFECPYCGRFHPTMERVVRENEDVRWVYRHFPLSNIHSEAVGSAIASECVADLGGNDAFWQFADAMFENQSSLGQELYVREATSLGINEEQFETCLEDEKIAEEVQADFKEVRSLGATGTPFSLVISADGSIQPLNGALPFDSVMNVISQVR